MFTHHLSREEYYDLLHDSHSPSHLPFPNFTSDLKDSEYSRKIGKWTPEEDELLHKYVPLFGEKQWRKISEYIPGRTSIQCLHRWTKILKPGLVKGPWTAEEDQRLMAWVKAEGPSKWAQAANFIKGRSGKQCRERWFNNLSPGVKKGNWTKEEDELIFELYQKYASSWSKIAKFIPGRTENAIKNRFYSTLRKLAADKRRVKVETEGPESVHAESEAEDELYPDHNIELSASGQPVNILYKLLQEKTAGDKQTKVKKEKSLKHVKLSMPVQERISNENKPKQAFNINGEKVVIVRDNRVTEKAIQDAADRLMQAEIEDNDLAFEQFLLSLDADVQGDFLTKEFDMSSEPDDLAEFDKLQHKILCFCQSNIRDLNDAFRTVTSNNRIDNASAPRERKLTESSIPRTSVSNIQSIPLKNEAPVLRENVIGATVVPSSYKADLGSPVAEKASDLDKNKQKSEGKETKEVNETREAVEDEKKLKEVKEKSVKVAKSKGIEEGMGGILSTMNSTISTASSIHQAYMSSLMEMAKSLPKEDVEENEKRMAFLFQQLFSLEGLLSKAKGDLQKLEGALPAENEGEECNDENETASRSLKIEEGSDGKFEGKVVKKSGKGSVSIGETKKKGVE